MPAFAFFNGRIFIGNGSQLDNAWLVVEDGLITHVSQEKPKLVKDCKMVDLKGSTLLPGLIDTHVHLCMTGAPDTMGEIAKTPLPIISLIAAKNAEKTLMAGFTTIRDMGCKDYIVLHIRDAIKQGLIQGPRILASGRMIAMTGGHGWQMGARQADGPHEIRKATREQIMAGCDVVKVMATAGVLTPGMEAGAPQLTYEELKACIEEAHKANRLVGTHAQGLIGIENAVKANVDTIEHGIFLNQAIIDLMIEKNTALVPTLSAPTNIMDKGPESGIPQEALDQTKYTSKFHLASAANAYKSKVIMAMGTDAGTPFNLHGENAKEIKLLTTIGMSNEEALIASTLTAAKVLRLGDKLGSLEKGKQADLIAVNGNCVEDLDILLDPENINLVMKQGEIVKNQNII